MKEDVCANFPSMFEKATRVNYGEYMANNVRSAVLANKICDADTSGFLNTIQPVQDINSEASAVASLVTAA